MGKLIRFDDAARDSLRRGVEQLTAAVRVTLGPRGRNVVIDHGSGVPTITNDGLTIASEIELANPFENMGVQFMREVASKTGLAAGDGTTTATVLAGSVVTHGLKAIASGCNPVAVKRGIDRGVEAVVAQLRKQARGVDTRDDIAQVATVSARGDGRVGELIAEAMDRVGRHGVVTVGEGHGLATTLKVVEGTRLQQGYVSPYFVTDAEQMESTLDNAYVLLADLSLSDAQHVLPALELAARAGRPLLVVAEDIEAEALATLVVNRLRGTVASVAVRAPESGARRRETLEDLAVLTGARLFAEDIGNRVERFTAADFGRVGRVLVDASSTLLAQGGGQGEAIRGRLAWLKREVRKASVVAERSWIEQRLACLAGGIAIVEVGGATESERQERKSRIEDALAATHSAVEEGVVTGGGVALLRAQPALADLNVRGDEAAGVEIVRRALEEPTLRIAENAGEDAPVILARVRAARGAVGFDALTGTICDLDRRGIVDPVKVTRCALEHAASIGSLVLTTDAIVVDAPPENGGSTPE
jgi:chaperonin GroEL